MNGSAKELFTKIPLDDIDPKDISFTFGDSMAKIDSADRKDPILKDTLLDFIKMHDNVDAFLDSIKQKYSIMEAQVWNNKYIPAS